MPHWYQLAWIPLVVVVASGMYVFVLAVSYAWVDWRRKRRVAAFQADLQRKIDAILEADTPAQRQARQRRRLSTVMDVTSRRTH